MPGGCAKKDHGKIGIILSLICTEMGIAKRGSPANPEASETVYRNIKEGKTGAQKSAGGSGCGCGCSGSC
jgi:hypothetical protein